jgi:uncharacterized membrane protein YdbT with pleckstrin-like domain
MHLFTLEEGEEIVARVHRHWFVFITKIVSLILAALLPLIFIAVLPREMVGELNLSSPSVGPFFVFSYAIWLLFIWVALFIMLTDYYLDVWIITNKRVVDIIQHGLFSRSSTSCFISRIQDIEVEIHGVIPTLLHFGTIKINTAGASAENISMNIAPYPQKIKDMIFQLQGKLQKNPSV